MLQFSSYSQIISKLVQAETDDLAMQCLGFLQQNEINIQQKITKRQNRKPPIVASNERQEEPEMIIHAMKEVDSLNSATRHIEKMELSEEELKRKAIIADTICIL
jgi:hypothetical protein